MTGSGGSGDDPDPVAGEDGDPHDPVIDAAVRSLVASRRCSPHRALGILLDHSTRTGRPVAEEARRLVAHDVQRGRPLVVYGDADLDPAGTDGAPIAPAEVITTRVAAIGVTAAGVTEIGITATTTRVTEVGVPAAEEPAAEDAAGGPDEDVA